MYTNPRLAFVDGKRRYLGTTEDDLLSCVSSARLEAVEVKERLRLYR